MNGSSGLRLAAGDHVVRFYDDDEDLAMVVVGYMDAALAAGAAVLVVASQDHEDAFRAGLRRRGVAVDHERVAGRLLFLDAAQTLDRFMIDGLPDPAAFEAVIGTVVRRAGASGRSVCAFGEMVAQLWDVGNVLGALELERLWNDLGVSTPFSLLCAYPTKMMDSAETMDAFAEVCTAHSEVIGGAPIADDAEVSRRFPRALQAPSRARRFVAETLTGWNRAELVDDGMLIVAELSANAVTHAGSGFTVSLSRTDGTVRITVGDTYAAAPVRRHSDTVTPTGRGLILVDALSRQWGHHMLPGGKLVWARLADDGLVPR